MVALSSPYRLDSYTSPVLCSTPSLQCLLLSKQATSFRSHRSPGSLDSLSSNTTSTTSSTNDSLEEFSSADEWQVDSDTEYDMNSFISLKSCCVRSECHEHPLEGDVDMENFKNTARQPVLPPQPSKATRLLRAIKSFRSLPSNSGLLHFNERMTDDIIPRAKTPEPVAIPLQTFSIESRLMKTQKSYTPAAPTRAREPRINSNFLRVYALDYCCKNAGHLQLSDYEIDLYYQEYYESGMESFDEYLDEAGYEMSPVLRQQLKLGVLAREKLWNSVILPPRNDPICHVREKYVSCDKRANALVRTSGKFVPWLNLQDFDSNNKKCVRPNGHTANLTQFTVKGWCNERWLAKTA
ncbi:hypothetical protein KL921_003954 [Ogataea angusta]|uniref:Uncharacterized protein n=1 Tax=Pichia angusta TaxID=870730 RepID=A0AAN6I4L8_PICAN|nr:uncharacterized protein KL928_004382 [Ogataea angusta]KAG7807659.1 hypothetical protein KL921_003954 [Ogataea angusta]KAG7816918.1 hypothetical protein KL928_004382 [Ogataea angusta]KAG7838868.1 hypothetical protein KL942_003864 [Ogataea angusta]KAG7844536.1 hypothetical protein KL941_003912 [Ogataea angusta]KAG7848526.1 hypothetical protein KL940_003381 [Ogataea angusta]